jgi:hypothetical protein
MEILAYLFTFLALEPGALRFLSILRFLAKQAKTCVFQFPTVRFIDRTVATTNKSSQTATLVGKLEKTVKLS